MSNDPQHHDNLLKIKRRRLAKLEEQAATYGISTPPEISIEIDDLREEIKRLEANLGGTPGFRTDAFSKWPLLLRHIRGVKEGDRCTPILGPGLTEMMFGSQRDIARNWADSYRFPMEPHRREDLAQIAQYLAINQINPYDIPPSEEHSTFRQSMLAPTVHSSVDASGTSMLIFSIRLKGTVE